MATPRHILPLVVLAQFAGGSLWFVGNAALRGLSSAWPEVEGAVGWMTSAVQLGFIVGTLLFAVLGLADRIRGHVLFFGAALAGATVNAAALLAPESFAWFLFTRVAVGVSLAGIYPIGMKLAASWYREGLGVAIGFLVGALVLGTAFPHLLGTTELDAATLLLTASVLATVGGAIVLRWVPEGPGVRTATTTRLRDAFSVFTIPDFRSAALGYFGHMWELYAFWAFVPFAARLALGPDVAASSVSLAAFSIIATGALACAVGGWLSRRHGSAAVAGVQLVGSGTCAVLSPAVLLWAPPSAALAFLVLWGAVVVGDSPQFSAIAARSAPADRVGTGLTLMNTIGFALTIPSIALLSALEHRLPPHWLLAGLAIGPVLGVAGLRRVWRNDPTRLSASSL